MTRLTLNDFLANYIPQDGELGTEAVFKRSLQPLKHETDYNGIVVDILLDKSAPAWNSSTHYTIDDIVSRNGLNFIAVHNSTNSAPRTDNSNSNWEILELSASGGGQSAGIIRHDFVSTAGQTNFVCNTVITTPAVFVEGVLADKDTYTVLNDTTVSFINGLSDGVEVSIFDTLPVESLLEVAHADSANKLSTPRTIDITGDITANAVAFDGTSNISISASVNNNSHLHTIANVTGLQTALNNLVVNNATTSVAGKVERATDAEASAGTDTVRYVTPKQLKTATNAVTIPNASTTVAGKVERATDAEASAGTDTTRYITPAQLQNQLPYATDTINGLVRRATTQELANGSSNYAYVSAYQFHQELVSSNASHGYQKFPSGIIFQWGKATSITNNASTAVSFPIAFPNQCFNVMVSLTDATSIDPNWTVVSESYTQTQFKVIIDGISGQHGTVNPVWTAIGY